jgi:hypothetical protein
VKPADRQHIVIRIDLIEALRHPGCALCYLAQQKSQRYVESLLDSAVIDVEQRDVWRNAKGFCNWHAGMAIVVPQAASSLALLYADVLADATHHLATLTASLSSAPWYHQFWRRHIGKRIQLWLRAWQPRQVCPACRLWHEQELLYLTVLLDDWHDATLHSAFAQSSGFCRPHVTRLMVHGTAHGHLPAFLTAQQERWQALQADLQEFIRKLDYRFAREPYGSEADAWQRVVALLAGHPGSS